MRIQHGLGAHRDNIGDPSGHSAYDNCGEGSTDTMMREVRPAVRISDAASRPSVSVRAESAGPGGMQGGSNELEWIIGVDKRSVNTTSR